MSLEESMKALADSNLKLSASFDRYADIVERFGLKIEKDNEGKQTIEQQEAAKDKPAGKTAAAGKDKPAASKPGRPKKTPDPVEEEDDGLGDEVEGDGLEDEITAPKGLTHDIVKTKLLEVKAAADGDKVPALAIVKEFGYNSLLEIKEKHYEDIWIAAETKLRELQG